MAFWEKVLDVLTNSVPVDRWVRAIGNVLKFLSLTFVLLFALMLALIAKDWGFGPGQRVGLIAGVMGLMLLVLLLGILLALLPGGLLYSPYEQSLNRGHKFGTKQRPLTRKELAKGQSETETPGLPPLGEEGHRKSLPKGKQK